MPIAYYPITGVKALECLVTFKAAGMSLLLLILFFFFFTKGLIRDAGQRVGLQRH